MNMKQLLMILALCWFSLKAAAQITVSEIESSSKPQAEVEVQQEKYDSLYNFKCGVSRGDALLKEYRKRIGQKVFFYGDTTYMKKVFFQKGRGFYSENLWKKNAKRISKWGFEYAIKSDLHYTNFYKKYFELVDVTTEGDAYIMKLKEEGASDYVYFFDRYGISGGFWTIAGFLVKARDLYLNKRFALVKNIPDAGRNSMRYMSNNEVLPYISMGKYIFGERRSIWKCIDVTLRKPNEPEYAEENVILVLRNEDGKYEDSYIRLDKFTSFAGIEHNPYNMESDSVFLGLFVPAEDYENYVKEQREYREKRLERLTKLYGQTDALKIALGEVELGFTRSMCQEAWGIPKDKNISTGSWGTHEQWVYEKDGKMKCLYFENDKLTAKDE